MRIGASFRLGPSWLIVGLAIVIAVAVAEARSNGDWLARCGRGFLPRTTQCDAQETAGACPEPLVAVGAVCDAPDRRVAVAATSFLLGPSDWEAEGRVRARWIHVEAFRIDAFETTIERWNAARDLARAARIDDSGASRPPSNSPSGGARAASGMSRDEAAAYCASRGGRLPTEEEWMAAAVSGNRSPPRYPWGDTGAVCRRAAWGLLRGPCGLGGTGPDTVGAHADGDASLGIHDLAGNVAEWVSSGIRWRIRMESPKAVRGRARLRPTCESGRASKCHPRRATLGSASDARTLRSPSEGRCAVPRRAEVCRCEFSRLTCPVP